MSKVYVEVKLPVVSNEFSTSYSEVEKPTGIQYMLLTIIANENVENKTWADMFDELNIPREMFGIFKRELDNMDGEMIMSSYAYDIDSDISDVGLTNIGKSAYEKMKIATNSKSIEGRSVIYAPGKLNKKYFLDKDFANVSYNDFDKEKYGNIISDSNKIENLVIESRDKLEIPQSCEIFDFAVKNDEIQYGTYKQKFSLDFDQIVGDFSISSGEVDEFFLKEHFNAKELFELMSDDIFDSPSKEITIMPSAWRDDISEYEKYSFILPHDFNLNRAKYAVVNKSKCNCINAHTVENYDFDAAEIISSTVGNAYYFVKMDTKIRGFEGSAICNMIIRRDIGEKEIEKLVKQIVENEYDGTDKGLIKGLSAVAILNNDELSLDLIRRHLSSASKKDFANSITTLQDYRNTKWYSKLPIIVEDVLAENKWKIDVVDNVLLNSKIAISGSKLAMAYKTGNANKDMETADMILCHSKDPVSVVNELNVSDEITNRILNGTDGDYKSEQFQKMCNASRLLNEEKKLLKMKSLSEYNVDPESLGDNIMEKIRNNAQIFNKDINQISNLIKSSEKYTDVNNYRSYFVKIADLSKTTVKISQLDDWAFAIKTCSMLSNHLKKLVKSDKLTAMIEDAHEIGIIKDSEYEPICELRDYRNICAHELETKPIDKRKRKEWANAVDRVCEIEPVNEEK